MRSRNLKKDNLTTGDEAKRNGIKISFFSRMMAKGMKWYRYMVDGVWSDTRRSFKVNVVKTLNLSVRSFPEYTPVSTFQ